jgi:hypothetical protein
MSTKTIKQRIALVAVSALTAGFLSVVAAPVANAAAHAARSDLACGATTTSSITLGWTASGAGDTGGAQASATYSTNGTDYIAMPTTTSAGAGTIITQSGAGTPALADGVAYSITIKTLNAGADVSAASNAVTCMVQAGVLHIGTTASTTGAAVASATYANQRAVGWITKSSTNGTSHNSGFTLVGGLVGTGVVYPGAKIPFVAMGSTTSGTGVGLTATGGTFDTFVCANGTATVNSTGTAAACVSGNGTAAIASGVLNISAGVGLSASLSAFRGTGVDDSTSPTNGALMGLWTFTVSSSSTVQVYAASKSTITSQVAIAKGATPSTSVAYDNTDLIQNGSVGYIYVNLKDALSSQILAASTTSLTATTTAGTIIGHATAASANSYAATGALTVITPADAGVYYVVVNQPVANTAGTATVNISLDGAVIATKTLKWAGDIATLAVDTVNSASTFIDGATATAPAAAMYGVAYVAKDAAGNVVTLAAQPSVDSATGALVGASVYAVDTLADGGRYQRTSVGYGFTTMIVPSGLNGAASYRLKLTNAVGTSIYSAVQTVKVSSGGPNSFVASWDKAQYAPGDIATLTITVKDAYGNPVGSGTALPGLTAGLIVSTGGLTAVGSACVDASYTDSAGVKTCKFAAGNTEGSYSYSVDLTTVAPQSATIGSLKIAATTAVVSNAQVLQSIVALIASINKQIQALQALILKKK